MYEVHIIFCEAEYIILAKGQYIITSQDYVLAGIFKF